jgi:hypothetical protein
MNSPDDIAARILASIASLPPAEQADALRGAISHGIKQMSVFRILEVRQRIALELDEDVPLVRETLDMIDGQLALREIAGHAGWR